MIIEPMTIEDGFLKRCLKNSYALMWRDVTIWLFYVFVAFLLSVFVNNLSDLIYEAVGNINFSRVAIYAFKFMFGLFLCFWGMEIAANLDYSTLAENGMFKTMKTSVKHTGVFIKENSLYIIIIMTIMEIFRMIVLKDAKYQPVNNSDMLEFMVATLGGMIDFIFWGFLLATQNRRAFSYPLIRQFSLENYDEARLMSDKGLKVNHKIDMFFTMVLPFVIILSPMFTLFILVPLVYPLVSLCLYLSFREIYLNKKENEKQPIKQTEGKLILVKH